MDLTKSEDFVNLIDITKQNENIIACVLFGSYAKGKQKPNSDIDICIIKKKTSKIDDLYDLMGFSSDKIDVLFFDNLSVVMKFKVLSEGKVLVLNDKREFFNIRRKFMRSYMDFYPKLKRQWKRMLKNV